MSKARFTLTLSGYFCALLLCLAAPAQAQPESKVPLIGYLAATSRSTNSGRLEAFRHGLRELGYIEGKNVAIELRVAEGRTDRLPRFAAELTRLKVDVIVSGGSTATRAAKEATTTIPIVMSQDNDPVKNGFVASLARPGVILPGLPLLDRSSALRGWSFLRRLLQSCPESPSSGVRLIQATRNR